MEIDEKKLINSGLSPTLYITLLAIQYNMENILQYLTLLGIFEKAIIELEKQGYVKITGDNISKDFVIRQKTLYLLGENSNVSEWYEQWRNLFPEGNNQSGYNYRGNKQEVLVKLQKFVKKYPKYSKEDIFDATRAYIMRCRSKNSYMQQAHYFIEKKDVGSTLLTELENLESNKIENTLQTVSKINKMI